VFDHLCATVHAKTFFCTLLGSSLMQSPPFGQFMPPRFNTPGSFAGSPFQMPLSGPISAHQQQQLAQFQYAHAQNFHPSPLFANGMQAFSGNSFFVSHLPSRRSLSLYCIVTSF